MIFVDIKIKAAYKDKNIMVSNYVCTKAVHRNMAKTIKGNEDFGCTYHTIVTYALKFFSII